MERKGKEDVDELRKKMDYLETMVEDLACENSRLLIKTQKLDQVLQEKTQLVSLLDKFQAVNAKLAKEAEDWQHKFEVSDKLRAQMKEYFGRYVDKQASQEQALDSWVQS